MEVPQTINKALVFKSERAQIHSEDLDAVAQHVAVEEEKSLSRDSSNVLLISAEEGIEEEKPKLPERKLKNLSRMTVAELQQKVNLKASSNLILIPQHWSFKLKYSQHERGIEKLAWKLWDFIKRVGIMKARQSLREREDQKATKVKMRKGV
ncbi:putative splicing factor 3b subunit 2 [Trichonephila inaurata madagascariensis]|uniref:Putative splicing factor 3b subunit 2 n=1 Tax=Trichonephila inaurata madagascariensis TaxID=2747483 RepID=A0A8X7C261_9ARAC|nr:putative splicing factor 3b subunit 2 [Trichonephila inaurata madagascariensis]